MAGISDLRDARDAVKAANYMARQEERAKDEAVSGSNIVSHEAKMKRRELEAQQNVFDSAYKNAVRQGYSESDASNMADQAVADSGIGSITPRLDRWKAENRRLAEAREAERPKEIDKFTPEGFLKDVNTSMAFGAESKLLTPEGRQRALKQAVQSGISFDEADKIVQDSFKKLQEIGKRDKWKGFGGGEVEPTVTTSTRPEDTLPQSPANVYDWRRWSPTTTPTGPTPPVKMKLPSGGDYGPVEMSQDITKGIKTEQPPVGPTSSRSDMDVLPAEAAEAARGAFDVLGRLGKTQRVSSDETKALEQLRARAALDPTYIESLTPMEEDIKRRTELFNEYDTARNALIKAVTPTVAGGSAKEGMSRKETAENVVNTLLRKRRESQY